MPIRISGMMSGVYTSAWCIDWRRPRHLCSASAEVVPIAQEISVASPATMSESQKLCIRAFSRMCPVKIMEYHLPEKPVKWPAESKKLMEMPFGMNPYTTTSRIGT